MSLKTLGLLATFLGKDTNNEHRSSHTLTFPLKTFQIVGMKAQISHSARYSKIQNMWRLSRRGNSPGKQHFRGKSSYSWIYKKIHALIPSIKKTLKKKRYKYHTSLHICTGWCFLTLQNLYHFSRKRRHTLLYVLQTFNMGETDINWTDALNSFNDGSGTRNKNVQNDARSFIKNCESKGPLLLLLISNSHNFLIHSICSGR